MVDRWHHLILLSLQVLFKLNPGEISVNLIGHSGHLDYLVPGKW